MEIKNIETLHEDHRQWMEDITAWHNELVYYSRVLLRLVEGAKDGPDTDKMEEFQSMFDNMQDQFESMRKNINAHDKSLAADHNDGHAKDHAAMGKQVQDFKNKFNALKNEFYKFEEKFIYE